jgi:hypothetical protein
MVVAILVGGGNMVVFPSVVMVDLVPRGVLGRNSRCPHISDTHYSFYFQGVTQYKYMKYSEELHFLPGVL